jgi:hypothetical protein
MSRRRSDEFYIICCRNYKSKLETLIKKINDIRETFIHVNQGKIKRLHKPTGKSPNPKLKKSRVYSKFESQRHCQRRDRESQLGMSRLIGTADKSADIWCFQNNR